MSDPGTTKEERFMMALYNTATKMSGPKQAINRYELGTSLGLHPRGIDTICNQLAQANFIKKLGPTMIQMTSQGEALVQNLQSS